MDADTPKQEKSRKRRVLEGVVASVGIIVWAYVLAFGAGLAFRGFMHGSGL